MAKVSKKSDNPTFIIGRDFMNNTARHLLSPKTQTRIKREAKNLFAALITCQSLSSPPPTRESHACAPVPSGSRRGGRRTAPHGDRG